MSCFFKCAKSAETDLWRVSTTLGARSHQGLRHGTSLLLLHGLQQEEEEEEGEKNGMEEGL